MSFHIENPRHLRPAEFQEICQLIFDTFDGSELLPYELDEWSVRGIAADLGGLFINTAARGGLFLARSQGGEIVGLVSSGQPKASLPAKEPPPEGDEDQYITSPPPALEETEESKKVREWRKNVQDPFTDRLFTSAFGERSPPACHISFLGVSPKAQKMGIGKALIGKVWELAEGHGVGVTLQTDTQANMEWYTSLGYTINATDELEVGGKRVRFWAISKGVVGAGAGDS